VPGERFDRVLDLELSADGRLAVYEARRGDQWTIVANGKKFPVPGMVRQLSISKDGKHFVAEVRRGPGMISSVMVDGRIGPEHECVRMLSVSFGGTPGAIVCEGKKQRMLVGDEIGDPYDKVWGLTFGPCDKRFAYLARRGAQRFVVTDSATYGPYQDTGTPDPKSREHVDLGDVCFAPGGAVVFRARDEAGWHLVVDGKTGPAFDHVYEPFSYAPGQVGYAALDKKSIRWVVASLSK